MKPVHYYHAHVYFELKDKALALEVRDSLAIALQGKAEVSRPIHRPIGPHPFPMFEIDFFGKDYPEVVKTIDDLRQGLNVLVHPLTGDDLADHRDFPQWLGSSVPLRLDVLK